MTIVKTPTPEVLEAAAHNNTRGGRLRVPTETVYGLGANALDGKGGGEDFCSEEPAGDPIL